MMKNRASRGRERHLKKLGKCKGSWLHRIKYLPCREWSLINKCTKERWHRDKHQLSKPDLRSTKHPNHNSHLISKGLSHSKNNPPTNSVNNGPFTQNRINKLIRSQRPSISPRIMKEVNLTNTKNKKFRVLRSLISGVIAPSWNNRKGLVQTTNILTRKMTTT